MVRLCSLALACLAICGLPCTADDAAIDALIDKLASSEAGERESAYQELEAKGPEAGPRLLARRNHPDAEARARIEKLLVQRALDLLRKTRLVCERTVVVTGGRVYSAAWSPDGKLLATGGERGDIVLWDALKRRAIQTVQTGTGDSVREIAFAIDGKHVWSNTGNIIVWKLDETLTKEREFELKGRPNFALNRDGRWAAWNEDNMKVVVVDAHSLEIVNSFVVTDRDSRITAIAFPPDGVSVAIGTRSVAYDTRDGVVSTWNVQTGKKTSEEVVFPGDKSGVALTWLADGTRVVRGNGGEVRWGNALANLSEAHYGFAISPDGKRVAFATREGALRIASSSLDTIATWSASGDVEHPLAWSPDGATLAGIGPEGLRLWNDGKAEDLRAHASLPHYVAFSGDSRFLAVSDRERTAFTNLETGATRDLALKAGLGAGPSGTDILVMTADKAALWNAESGEERTVLRRGLKEIKFPFAKLAPDGKSLLWFGDREQLALYPVGDGPERKLPDGMYPYSGDAFRWSPDSKFAAFGGYYWRAGDETRGLSILDTNGREVHQFLLDEAPDTVEWSPDGRFVWWSDEKSLHRVDVQSGQREVMLGQSVRGWHFLDDSLAVCTEEGGAMALWHAPSMSKLCVWPWEGCWGPATLSPDHKRVAFLSQRGITVYSFQK